MYTLPDIRVGKAVVQAERTNVGYKKTETKKHWYHLANKSKTAVKGHCGETQARINVSQNSGTYKSIVVDMLSKSRS